MILSFECIGIYLIAPIPIAKLNDKIFFITLCLRQTIFAHLNNLK